MSRIPDRMRWVRVVDDHTGHQYDVRACALRAGMTPLENPRWPDLPAGAQPRRSLHNVTKAGTPPPVDDPAVPASRRRNTTTRTSPAVSPAHPEKDNTDVTVD